MPVETFANLPLWLALVVTLLGGAIGGVVYELLILHGNIEMPHRLTAAEQMENPHAIASYMYDLGIWARVLIGAFAAVAALVVVNPESLIKLLATAIIAGSAGTSIFRSLQDRLLAAVAQKESANLRATNTKLHDKVDEALVAFDELKGAVRAVPLPPSTRSIPGAAAVDQSLVDRVEQLLNEAKGIGTSRL
ncbi:MAG: hypothetical protein KF832_27820 [Caldilineaceae bacterium]|nr:hypothetical protein [Caldilineaceae bacterium]